jgi:pSer/pThr/pTyr-binding forkhead associated (FHA) protein
MSHVYCPECGFQNPESANYCARCGAMLVKPDEGEATMTFTPEDRDETGGHPAIEDLRIAGPALVVRSGGGRAGETFTPQGERTTIGRSPDCGVFLDDVTVSRRHAVLTEHDGRFTIEDQGSLNGTFVNRRRVESAELEDGDEIQIGKYRMTFMAGRP